MTESRSPRATGALSGLTRWTGPWRDFCSGTATWVDRRQRWESSTAGYASPTRRTASGESGWFPDETRATQDWPQSSMEGSVWGKEDRYVQGLPWESGSDHGGGNRGGKCLSLGPRPNTGGRRREPRPSALLQGGGRIHLGGVEEIVATSSLSADFPQSRSRMPGQRMALRSATFTSPEARMRRTR